MATPIHNPPGMEQTQHKDIAHPTPTVRNQATRPKYLHTGRTSSHRDKRSRLSYTRHTLDPIPEAHRQHEVWTSQLWAANPSRNLPSVSVPKRLRISQLPKARAPNSRHQQNKASNADVGDQISGKVRASLHDGPLQETKALRIASKSYTTKERRSKFIWVKLLRLVNRNTFLKAVAYILPQLVCLQHRRGQVLPSLTRKGIEKEPPTYQGYAPSEM